jgi:hypothetical protein
MEGLSAARMTDMEGLSAARMTDMEGLSAARMTDTPAATDGSAVGCCGDRRAEGAAGVGLVWRASEAAARAAAGAGCDGARAERDAARLSEADASDEG